jgi:hypothetical protein
MPIAQIQDNDRKERFVATAGQTVFPYDFPIYAATDLQVRRERSGVITTLTYGADYSVTGVQNQTGGNVVLTAGATLNDIIVILSNMPSARTGQFVNGGDLSAAALEAEFNRNRILIQQNYCDGRNALLFPPTDPTMQDLPPIALRANRFLAFDQNGQPYAAVPTAGTVLDAISRLGDNMSGPFGFTPGTASAPGLRPNNDNGSGFFAAPGFIAVSIDGAESERFMPGGLSYTADRPASITRLLKNKIQEAVSIKDFGAAGNGVTDDTAAFQAAINTGKRVFIPNGNYNISASLNITSPVFIDAESKQAIISLPAAASFDLFRIASNNVFFRNFTVQGNGTQTGSVFKLRSSIGSFEIFSFEGIETKQCCHFLTDDNSSGVLTLCYIDNCLHRQPTGNGIDVNDIFAFFFADHFTIDYVGITAPASNTPGIRVRNNQGMRFSNIDILGGTIAGMSNRRGVDIQNSEAIWLNRVMADTMGGEGIFFQNCAAIHLIDVTASLCDLHQIVIAGCNNVIGSTLYAAGRNTLAGTTGQDGIRISGGSTGVAISNLFATANTQHGLHALDAGTSVTVAGLNSRANTGRGFRCAGLSSVVSAAQLAANTAGNYNLGGAFDHVAAIQLNSGALVANATGPATI